MSNYALLIDCYLSGQMSEKSLLAHMAEDAVFAQYAKRTFLKRSGVKG